ncbi:MAG: DNA/RNA non-specific endonuclease, partial [Bacteroidota bacterium]
NHVSNRGGASSTILRVAIFAAVILGVVYFFIKANTPITPTVSDEVITSADTADDRSFYIPESTTGQIIQHPYFTLSYSEKHEQAEWVSYVLTRERLQIPWVDRTDRFEPDTKVKTGSATWYDYRGSGYDRGHLAPAADMAFSIEAMQNSFLMSNISPQSHDFNKGIWKELEHLTRTWAKKYKKLYVVTGPVLSRPNKGKIGDNGVTIPSAFYKVLLDISEPEQKGIGFIIPNQISYEPLYEYVASIDQVEELTGINFFPNLMTPVLEKSLERDYNVDLWEFSKQKYDLRINKWNKE